MTKAEYDARLAAIDKAWAKALDKARKASDKARKAASILGQRGRGKAKTLTDEQREQRRAQMAVARETRWSKLSLIHI